MNDPYGSVTRKWFHCLLDRRMLIGQFIVTLWTCHSLVHIENALSASDKNHFLKYSLPPPYQQWTCPQPWTRRQWCPSWPTRMCRRGLYRSFRRASPCRSPRTNYGLPSPRHSSNRLAITFCVALLKKRLYIGISLSVCHENLTGCQLALI